MILFKQVQFDGYTFELTCFKKKDGSLRVYSPGPNPVIELHMGSLIPLYETDRVLFLDRFFYNGPPSGDLWDLAFLRTACASFVNIADLNLKDMTKMIDRTMRLLSHLGMYFRARGLVLHDVSRRGNYFLCNDAFKGPAFLPFFSWKFGFIALDSDDIRDTNFVAPHSPSTFALFESAIEFGQHEQAENKRLAATTKIGGAEKQSLEYIVSRWYAYFRDEKKNPPSRSLPPCQSKLVRFLAPELHEWISYGVTGFFREKVDITYTLRSGVLVCV